MSEAASRFGHFHDENGRSTFRVFAPEKHKVVVHLTDTGHALPLAADPLGYWHASCIRLAEGSRDLVELDGRRSPDIASRRQPDGVHGASAIATPQRASSPGWRGVRIEDAIIYELHLGTFTPRGTLAAACENLRHLAELGITVVEPMPIAAFPGHRNWGYERTYLFALQADNGDYSDLKRFTEAAHALGMALLDVVYNHFGPEGNYSRVYGPCNPADADGAQFRLSDTQRSAACRATLVLASGGVSERGEMHALRGGNLSACRSEVARGGRIQ